MSHPTHADLADVDNFEDLLKSLPVTTTASGSQSQPKAPSTSNVLRKKSSNRQLPDKGRATCVICKIGAVPFYKDGQQVRPTCNTCTHKYNATSSIPSIPEQSEFDPSSSTSLPMSVPYPQLGPMPSSRNVLRKSSSRPGLSRNPDNPHYPQAHGSSTQLVQPTVLCVICRVKPCQYNEHVTCSLTCAEKLARVGANQRNCDYCHQLPKIPGYNQCSNVCWEKAKLACLLCKSRPKHKQYHLCGKTCRDIATKWAPLLLEAPSGHVAHEKAKTLFQSAWQAPGCPCPEIKKIYKIIESEKLFKTYDQYKRRVGNEVFLYHGTKRTCTLGSLGNTELCKQKACNLCSILQSSFKTSLARNGAFGRGIYASSASNKAFSFTGIDKSMNGTEGGALLVAKVVLGKIRQVTGWKEVVSCPRGFNSFMVD